MPEQYLSTKEAAAYLTIPEATLAYWRSMGIGPAYYKFGRNVRYKVTDIEKYVRGKRVEPSVSQALDDWRSNPKR